VLESENRKDFPAEWNAVKIYAQGKDVEPILTALDRFESDFMEENILDALEQIAPEEAFEEMHARAQKRNIQPIRILGRIGNDEACETLHDFLGGGDVKLEKTTLRALGAIGSEGSTQHVANRLVADNAEIRSLAARSLGLIGDTRAIEPLSRVLDEDDADEVRASAAWALNQIGTESALDAAAEYADDRSYIVQHEAEKATGA
jgi:HEAT repeat protein